MLAPLWMMMACSGDTSTDTPDSAGQIPPSWTQVQLSCNVRNHAWTAYASGLHGHAQLRLVSAQPDETLETHPMAVHDADPGGTWTLFQGELTVTETEPTLVPGVSSTHDCRRQGIEWTWALDLLEDGKVLACTAWEASDTGEGPQQVATCDPVE